MTDLVNHPPHYKHGDIECIHAIKAALGDDGFRAYGKADWYMRRLLLHHEQA